MLLYFSFKVSANGYALPVTTSMRSGHLVPGLFPGCAWSGHILIAATEAYQAGGRSETLSFVSRCVDKRLSQQGIGRSQSEIGTSVGAVISRPDGRCLIEDDVCRVRFVVEVVDAYYMRLPFSDTRRYRVSGNGAHR